MRNILGTDHREIRILKRQIPRRLCQIHRHPGGRGEAGRVPPGPPGHPIPAGIHQQAAGGFPGFQRAMGVRGLQKITYPWLRLGVYLRSSRTPHGRTFGSVGIPEVHGYPPPSGKTGQPWPVLLRRGTNFSRQGGPGSGRSPGEYLDSHLLPAPGGRPAAGVLHRRTLGGICSAPRPSPWRRG